MSTLFKVVTGRYNKKWHQDAGGSGAQVKQAATAAAAQAAAAQAAAAATATAE